MSKLPSNWKPCEVNEAPGLNQYEINKSCLFFVNQLLTDLEMTEEQGKEIELFVGLYKNIPSLINQKYPPYTGYDWKPCI